MSVATEARSAIEDNACTHCQSTLADDQEWCLECGTARTLVHDAPDWRIPLAVLGAVVTVVLAGLVLALVGLSGSANRIAAAQVTNSPTSPGHAGPRPAAGVPTTPAGTLASGAPAPRRHVAIADWPVGLDGWTVVLAAASERSSAEVTATRIAAAGTPVGVLDSSQHPSMRPGEWIVFTGRYPNGPAARLAARLLKQAGISAALARLVAPPGGS